MSPSPVSPQARDLGSRSVLTLFRRKKHMAQVAANPNHRRHRHGELAQPQANGQYSSLSVTSLASQNRDMDVEEGGADIPDIPLKRPASRLPQDKTFNPSRFEEAWVEDDSNWTPHGPINPNALNVRKDRR